MKKIFLIVAILIFAIFSLQPKESKMFGNGTFDDPFEFKEETKETLEMDDVFLQYYSSTTKNKYENKIDGVYVENKKQNQNENILIEEIYFCPFSIAYFLYTHFNELDNVQDMDKDLLDSWMYEDSNDLPRAMEMFETLDSKQTIISTLEFNTAVKNACMNKNGLIIVKYKMTLEESWYSNYVTVVWEDYKIDLVDLIVEKADAYIPIECE